MKKTVLAILMIVLWGSAMSSAAAPSEKKAIGVVVVDGQSGNLFYDWKLAASEAPTIFPTVEWANAYGNVASPDHPTTANDFGELADEALLAMRKRAEELKVGGVAIVAYFEGDSIQSWDSKMIVVGRMKDNPSATDKGSNLLAIAYAKAAEMADTLKDSGSHVRPPMTGEFGWNGGVIVHGKRGYLIAAFSGGKDQDDVSVSRAGVAVLEKGL